MAPLFLVYALGQHFGRADPLSQMFTVIVLGYLQPPHCSIHFSVQKNNKETAGRLAAESGETLTVNIGLITPAAAPTVPPALPRSAPLTSYLGPLFPLAGIYLPNLCAHVSRARGCVSQDQAGLRSLSGRCGPHVAERQRFWGNFDSIGRETTEKTTENGPNSRFMLFITGLFVFLKRQEQVRKLTRDELTRYILRSVRLWGLLDAREATVGRRRVATAPSGSGAVASPPHLSGLFVLQVI